MVHDGTSLSCLPSNFRSLSPRWIEVEGNIKLGIAFSDLSPTHNIGVDTYDINDIEHLPEEHMESFRAVGIKVREHRDFAFEPMPNSSNASENFDLVLCLIGTDWHMRMRNSRKNYVMQYTRLSFVSSRWAGLPSPTSSATSTRANMQYRDRVV